jgi:hypothetical protein
MTLNILDMRLTSSTQPVLQRWLWRGALIGMGFGVAAITAGYALSWRAGNMEPLEGTFWWMMTATTPLSLAVISVADCAPCAIGPWTAFVIAFVVLPVIQGTLVALILWTAVRVDRWRASSRATV